MVAANSGAPGSALCAAFSNACWAATQAETIATLGRPTRHDSDPSTPDRAESLPIRIPVTVDPAVVSPQDETAVDSTTTTHAAHEAHQVRLDFRADR